MRQFILAVVGIFMVSALAACGGGTNSPSDQDRWCGFAPTLSGKSMVQDAKTLPDLSPVIKVTEGLENGAPPKAAKAARQMVDGIREMRSQSIIPRVATPMAESGAVAFDEQVRDVCGGGQ